MSGGARASKGVGSHLPRPLPTAMMRLDSGPHCRSLTSPAKAVTSTLSRRSGWSKAHTRTCGHAVSALRRTAGARAPRTLPERSADATQFPFGAKRATVVGSRCSL